MNQEFSRVFGGNVFFSPVRMLIDIFKDFRVVVVLEARMMNTEL